MKFLKKKETIALFAVFLLALFLRLYKLGSLPLGLYEEEVTNAYVGRFILQNGVDPYGNRLPLLYFDKFGDYPPVLPLYLSGLATYVFGFTEFAARFSIALIGALTIFPVYGLALLIFQNKWWGIFAGIILAILPWHVVLSRTSAEGIIGLAAYTLALYLLIQGIIAGRKKTVLLSFVFFFLTYFLYPSFRLLVPLTLLPIILMVPHGVTRRHLVSAMIVSFVLTGTIALTPWGKGRLVQTGILSSDEAATHVAIRNTMFANGDGSDNVPIARTFHNKVTGYARYFLEQYVSYFSPMHLFLDAGGQRRYYNVPAQGLLLISLGPLLLFGLFPMVKHSVSAPVVRLIVYLLLIAPLPAAITIDFPPHAHRAIAMVVPLVLLATYGAYSLTSLMNPAPADRYGARKQYVVIGLLIILLSVEGVYFWHQYEQHEAAEQSILRNGGDKELAKYLIANGKHYDQVIAPVLARLPIYYLYFSGNVDRSLAGKFTREVRIERLDNITLLATECPSDKVSIGELPKNTLIVDYAKCLAPDGSAVVDSIIRRDSTGAYTLRVPR